MTADHEGHFRTEEELLDAARHTAHPRALPRRIGDRHRRHALVPAFSVVKPEAAPAAVEAEGFVHPEGEVVPVEEAASVRSAFVKAGVLLAEDQQPDPSPFRQQRQQRPQVEAGPDAQIPADRDGQPKDATECGRGEHRQAEALVAPEAMPVQDAEDGFDERGAQV